MSNGNGEEPEPMACPIDPKHMPGECRVIEARLQAGEREFNRLRAEVLVQIEAFRTEVSRKIDGQCTLLGFLIDEVKLLGARQGKKIADPRRVK